MGQMGKSHLQTQRSALHWRASTRTRCGNYDILTQTDLLCSAPLRRDPDTAISKLNKKIHPQFLINQYAMCSNTSLHVAKPEEMLQRKVLMNVQVAAGVGHMLFLVDSESETIKKLEEFHPEVETEASKGEEEIQAEVAGKGA